ncbi:hypothetical protein VTK73DRAFT_1466 [Phialemonium thermophilum]|uniref:Uncharacterized protein n=1 Tax=Phialemonium thermophilum TaxID=223376 RepID=A0ABR3X971_9PEZI
MPRSQDGMSLCKTYNRGLEVWSHDRMNRRQEERCSSLAIWGKLLVEQAKAGCLRRLRECALRRESLAMVSLYELCGQWLPLRTGETATRMDQFGYLSKAKTQKRVLSGKYPRF